MLLVFVELCLQRCKRSNRPRRITRRYFKFPTRFRRVMHGGKRHSHDQCLFDDVSGTNYVVIQLPNIENTVCAGTVAVFHWQQFQLATQIQLKRSQATLADHVDSYRHLPFEHYDLPLRVQESEGQPPGHHRVAPATREFIRIERRKVCLDNSGESFEITDFLSNFNYLAYIRELG